MEADVEKLVFEKKNDFIESAEGKSLCRLLGSNNSQIFVLVRIDWRRFCFS